MSAISVSPAVSLSRISVIGLGAMGTALANAFLSQGHSVTVWNRTRAKADALLSKGAHAPESIANVIEASDLIVACVLDYRVLREMLGAATASLAGRTIVNLSTGSPKDAREMSAWISKYQGEYLDGGIMATPTMIGQPESLVIYSGSETAFQTYREVLEVLGTSRYVGHDVGMASLQDMTLLSVMYGVFSGFFHAVALAGSEGIKASEVVQLINPWIKEVLTFLPTYAGQIDTRDYTRDVVANLGMQATAVENIVRASKEQGIRPDLLMPLLGLFQQRAAQGHGQEDISGIVEIIKAPSI